jgi:hypothetical protein
MLIGTSFGQCLKDILTGEVAESNVVLIITRTMFPDAEKLMTVVEQYYYGLNGGAYDLSVGNTKTIEEAKEVALRLFNSGKIHQPRLFHDYHSEFIHPGLRAAGAWIELAPANWNNTPAVVEAYEQYKLLDSLTK